MKSGDKHKSLNEGLLLRETGKFAELADDFDQHELSEESKENLLGKEKYYRV